MKKNFKAIIAAMLAAVMAFGGVSAFAADENELIWDYYGEYYYYDYAGELAVGENSFDKSSPDPWFTFEVQTAGFYYLSYSPEEGDVSFVVPESFEGDMPYGDAGCFYKWDDDISGFIYYLEEGKQIVAMDIYYFSDLSDSDIFNFNIEFYGEEITSLTVDETLILNYDLYLYEDSEENGCSVETDVTIEFSSGNTATRYYVDCVYNSEIVAGKNTLTTTILGKEYPLEVDVMLISDIIETAEISNIGNYTTIYEYYDGYSYTEPSDETLTVTYKDGTTDSVIIDSDEPLVLPNGKEVWYGTSVDVYREKASLDVYVAGNIVKSYDCTVVPVSASENFDELSRNNAHCLSSSSYYFRQALISILECDTIDEFLNYGASESADRLYWAFDYFLDIFRGTFALVSYLITF